VILEELEERSIGRLVRSNARATRVLEDVFEVSPGETTYDGDLQR